jgi:hypothetical protein
MKKLHIVLKSIFFIAATLLILEFSPQMVYASNVMVSEDPYTGQVLKVRVDGTNGTVIYFRSNADTFTIPATIRGFQNTTITITGIEREAFRNCINLRTLTIPDTVTSIGENAFLSCSNLTTVNMPTRLNSLGKYAFGECRSLRSITIPNGITVINDSMFSGCSSLTTVNLPDGITKIGRGAFKGCSSLASFTIPNSVTHIESLAFCRCSALKSIAIPSGITTIYEQTFKECTSLTNITLPEGITRIDDLAFDHCSSLAGIDLPDSLRGTGMFLFKDCRALKSITLHGRTFLPIRALITEMGGNVEWDGTTRKVTIIYNGKRVELWIGQTKASVNNIETTMEAAPFISSTGRTMLPLRFVGESLGCDVSWNGTTKSVTIAYDTVAVKTPSAANTPVPSALLPSGVPNSLPAPAIANLQLLKDDSDVSYFRLEVTVPDVVRTLDQQRPADGWVDLETSKKVDNEDWIADGGGLEVFMGAPVPGKSGVYYLTFELLDEGGLAETLINARKYTFKARFNYAYGVGDGYEYVYSPWSNELSGQSESYYSSNDNNDDGIVD